jgi:hypothetical protein
VDYAGVEVGKRQRLITLFSPELAQKTSFSRAVAASQPGRSDDMSRVAINSSPGDRVVTSRNVLIDAQAQLNRGGEPDDAEAEAMISIEPEAGGMKLVRRQGV